MYRINRKITKKEPRKYIFSEGIDYSKTGKKSIWGDEGVNTRACIDTLVTHGSWLNIAAGDGRYTTTLLEKADFLTAVDIDEGALSKLLYNTPKQLHTKLTTKVLDMTKKLPFNSKSFDGIFCVGVLHFFPPNIINSIFQEIDRVLKPSGHVILNFATDVQRIKKDESLLVFDNEPLYSCQEIKLLVRKFFKEYRYTILIERDDMLLFPKANPPYTFSSNTVLFSAEKQ